MLAWLLTSATLAHAQNGSNVLVVVNTASAAADSIATRYMQARDVPWDQIVRISTETDDEIGRAAYEREIERPIAEWITRNTAQDRILYIVLIKGVPLRIAGTTGRNGTVASVDSELTLLYRKLVGIDEAAVGPTPNPYFRGTRPLSEVPPFTHTAYDIYLVSRLDGFDSTDVVGLIDRGSSPSRSGSFVFDSKGTPNDRIPDGWLQGAAEALATAGYQSRVVIDTTPSPVGERKNVLGYASWGSNDPAIRTRQIGLDFVPGALATLFVSTDARTLQEPPDDWKPGKASDRSAVFHGSTQSLAGDLIREGATGVAAYVAEPFLDGTLRPDTLFPAYVAGFNLVESFYLAMPYLSWQTVVFGDPLCAPFRASELSAEETAPALDVETELPVHFAQRRVELLSSPGVASAAVKLMLKGEARRRAGDTAGTRQALEQATAIDPRLTGAHLILGSLHEEAGEYDMAIERYRKVLAVAPKDPIALNNLAYALAVYKKAPAEALSFAERAYAASNGAFPTIADTLGWTYYLLGNYLEAERVLSEAAAAAPDQAELHLHLAHVYAALARKDAALAALARCLEIDATLAERDDVKALQALLGGPPAM